HNRFIISLSYRCLHDFSLLFSLLTRPPPTSTLFPYTTLFRSNVVTEPAIDNLTTSEIAAAFGADLILLNLFDTLNPKVSGLEVRSEEHTSELQSRFDLVCRLLLEKKKHRTM